MVFSLRNDRLATLYLTHLLKRILQGGGRKSVEILMCHGISDIPVG